MRVSRLVFLVFLLGLFYLASGEKKSESEIDPVVQGEHQSILRKVRKSGYYSDSYNHHSDESEESQDNENSETSEDSDGCDDSEDETGNPLLVVLLKGYRWDYYEKNKELLPAMTEFRQNGVSAEWVNPAVPSSGSTNWQTINTGVTVDRHGIYEDHMLRCDVNKPVLVDVLNLTATKDDVWWQLYEPAWATAVRQGKSAYCYHWARCDVPFHGIVASADSTGYQNLPFPLLLDDFKAGMEQAKKKLKTGTDLVLVSGKYTDAAGHLFGPDSSEMLEALINVDNIMADFFAWLKEPEQCKLNKKLNTVLLSDHGMKSFGRNNSDTTYILFREFFEKHDVKGVVVSAAFTGYFFDQGNKNKAELLQNLKKMKGSDCYTSKNIPERYHFKQGPFNPPICCFARPGFGFVEENTIPPQGEHGWIVEADPNMRAMFSASGPCFNKNAQIGVMDMWDVKQVFDKCLGFPPMPTDGDWEHVKGMFA